MLTAVLDRKLPVLTAEQAHSANTALLTINGCRLVVFRSFCKVFNVISYTSVQSIPEAVGASPTLRYAYVHLQPWATALHEVPNQYAKLAFMVHLCALCFAIYRRMTAVLKLVPSCICN